MASLVLAGNTSGSVTISSPAVSGTTTLTLPATSGTVMVNGPAFSAYQSTAQALTANVVTKIQFQTKTFDTNSNYDNTTNYRFTPTVAGYYQVNCAFEIATAYATLLLYVYKNGSFIALISNSGSALAGGAAGSYLVYMNGSTDYIEIYGSSSVSQNTNNSTGYTYFQGFMVRGA